MATILLISPEPWSAHSVSKHHYARLLAQRGHHVLFLEPPDSRRHGLHLTPIPGNPGLEVIKTGRTAPGLRFMPALFRRALERSWLKRLERRIRKRVDVVWLFENSRFYDLRFAGDRLKIYHQVDINQTFHPAEAAKTATICFCTTDLIKEELLPHADRVHVIHHGLQQSGSAAELSEEHRLRFGGSGPHLLYAGNLAMAYLDVELLAAVAKDNPDATLHLVGGAPADAPLRRALFNQPNVVWWGQMPSTTIPALLEQADILLVTYLERHWRDQANPHKLMEYLGSGKVVVATYTHQYRSERSLLAMSDLGGDYLTLLREVKANLDKWNSPDRQLRRKAFARENTYEKQLERIESLLVASGLKTFGELS